MAEPQVITASGLRRAYARGPFLALRAPISIWGGLDLEAGTVIDAAHPERGCELAGRIVWTPGLKGSTAGPGALLELIAAGLAPAAIITPAPEAVLLAGSAAARSLGLAPPVLGRAEAPPLLESGAICVLEVGLRTE